MVLTSDVNFLRVRTHVSNHMFLGINSFFLLFMHQLWNDYFFPNLSLDFTIHNFYSSKFEIPKFLQTQNKDDGGGSLYNNGKERTQTRSLSQASIFNGRIDVICLLELFNQLMYFARGFKVYVEFFISLNPLSRGRRWSWIL
jgi:hypothetical protein